MYMITRVKYLLQVILMSIETFAQKCTTALCYVCAGIIPLSVLMKSTSSPADVLRHYCYCTLLFQNVCVVSSSFIGVVCMVRLSCLFISCWGKIFTLIYNYHFGPTSTVQHQLMKKTIRNLHSDRCISLTKLSLVKPELTKYYITGKNGVRKFWITTQINDATSITRQQRAYGTRKWTYQWKKLQRMRSEAQ